jgi:hypothetical protein
MKEKFKILISEKYFDFYFDDNSNMFEFLGKKGRHIRLRNCTRNHKEFGMETRVQLNLFRKKYKPNK